MLLDRREFVGLGAVAAPGLLLGARRAAAAPAPVALVTADTEAHVAVVSLLGERVVRRIATREGPRSIQSGHGGRAVVAHAAAGVVTLLEGRPVRVRRVLRGFVTPRYTAITADGRLAYVSDGGSGEVAVVDLRAGRVLRRVPVGDGARHLALSPSGRSLWVALGSSATAIVVLGLDDGERPRVRRRIRPPLPVHDVVFAPGGRRVWLSAGRDRRLLVYAATGRVPLRLLGADAGPQHLGFGPGVAYATSGDEGLLRVHALRDGRVLRRVRVPIGSYNVQRAGDRVLTPSLGTGALTVLDLRGGRRTRIRVAAAAHDACVI